jgi:hypothetical protein
MQDISLNPYDVLGVTPSTPLDDVQRRYKRLALQAHPDKQGGSAQLFELITRAYQSVRDRICARDADAQHFELKQAAAAVVAAQHPLVTTASDTSGSQFDAGRFNKNFEEHRLPDVAQDGGYGEWMRTHRPPDAARLQGSYQIDRFNSAFDSLARSGVPENALIPRGPPEPACLHATMSYAILGDKPTDYSSDNALPSAVQYCDYRRAHTTGCLVDPTRTQVRDARTLEQYQRERDAVRHTMNPAELEAYTAELMEQRKQERQRVKRLNRQDRAVAQQYAQVSRLLLQQ